MFIELSPFEGVYFVHTERTRTAQVQDMKFRHTPIYTI